MSRLHEKHSVGDFFSYFRDLAGSVMAIIFAANLGGLFAWVLCTLFVGSLIVLGPAGLVFPSITKNRKLRQLFAFTCLGAMLGLAVLVWLHVEINESIDYDLPQSSG